MRFSFLYHTTDGRCWLSYLDATDWQAALDAVADCQGYQCGAVVSVIDADTGAPVFDAEPPDCSAYLRDHPAGRFEP